MENRLGRYELVTRLATGGMGEIFLARLSGEGGFEKRVVLKRLLPELVPSGQYVQMFLDEARLTARLTHPNVCEVYELGVDQGQYFIVMPYLEGVAFSQVMRRQGDAREHLRLVAGALAQACAGLHHAHDLTDDAGVPLGVVHRDVSPSNLFVTTDGVVKVLDFGIAKARIATSVTEKGMLKGKLAYMSPEQLGDGSVDRRSDVFCLGIVLHEAITGRRLFHREPAIRAAEAVLAGDIPDPVELEPAVPRALAQVATRALERDPARRFQSAREMGDALSAAAGALGGPMNAAEIAAAVRTRFAAELDERSSVVTRELGATPAPTMLSRPTPPRKRPSLVVPIVVLVAIAAAVTVAILDADPESASAADPPSAPADSIPPAAPSPRPPAPDPTPPTPDPTPPVRAPPPRTERPRLTGWLSVDSTPFATIHVDGVRLGPTPIIKRKLTAGKHRLEAVTKDGRKQRLTVHVDGGRVTPLQLSW